MTTRLLSSAVRPLVCAKHVADVTRQRWQPFASFVPTSMSRNFVNSVFPSSSLTASNLSSGLIARQMLWPFRSRSSIWAETGPKARTASTPSPPSLYFFSTTSLYRRSPFLHDVLARFASTRPGSALRNTYYSRSRVLTQSRLRGGGSSGGGGFGPFQRIKTFINALPPSVIVWTIIALNGIVFLAWQYAESTLVGQNDGLRIGKN